jgi:PAS domain S-box-containing protein
MKNSDDLRNKIIGLGANSFKKSYYPELENKVEELQLFHQIFEKTNDLVIVIEPEEKLIKYINNSVADHFWYNKEYINLPVERLLGANFNQQLELFEKEEKKNKFIFEIKQNTKHYALEAVLNTIEIAGEKKIVAIIRDITEHLLVQNELKEKNHKLNESNAIIKQINKELILAKEKAEQSDQLKSAFLANMSHEIRTPMNAIIGFSNLLAKPSITLEQKQGFIDIINSSGKQLLNIISDIVDISKIESGQLNVIHNEFNINNLINELFTQFSLELEKTKPKIKLNVVKSLQNEVAYIISDPHRIKQIFINLLSNAIKFTHEGSIKFGYKIENSKKITFFCKDTGIGIAQESHQHIFERFAQSFDARQNNYGGTGLGLSITKGIVELLGGNIYLESDTGKGAHFWFELPYISNNKVVFEKKGRSKNQVFEWPDATILIAEDEDFNYMYLRELLSSSKINILRARNGKEAITIINNNPAINLVLMDLKMPILNGFESTKEIKKINKNIPIIAQTAYALSGDREKALDAGCNDYISKPIEKEKLFELIAAFV